MTDKAKRKFAVRVLLVLLALLPIQWVVLKSLPGPRSLALKPPHLAASLLICHAVFSAACRMVIVRYRWFVLIAGIYILSLTFGALYSGETPVSALQQLIYALTALAVAGTFATGDLRILKWSAFAAVLTFALWFSWGFLKVGQNPLSGFLTLAQSTDSLGLQKLFRQGFIYGGLDVEVSATPIRHDIFASILVAVWVSIYAERVKGPGSSGPQRLLRYGAIASGVGLVLLSLSRVVILSLLITSLLPIARVVTTGSVKFRQAQTLVLMGLAVTMVIVSPIGSVLGHRFFTETTSYSEHGHRFKTAAEAFNKTPLTGADIPSGHNIVLDTWAESGIVGALVALGLFGALAILWLRMLRSYLIGDVLDARTFPLLGLGSLALIWVSTVGGGAMNLAAWISVGVLGGASFQDPNQFRSRIQPALSFNK